MFIRILSKTIVIYFSSYLKGKAISFKNIFYHFTYEEFFKTIIEEVPNNSLLYLYELHILERNYYSDLKNFAIKEGNNFVNERMGKPEAIIKLDKEAKKVLLSLWNNTSMLSDLIHFSIVNNNQIIVESFDALQNTAIKKEILKNKRKWNFYLKRKLFYQM